MYIRILFYLKLEIILNLTPQRSLNNKHVYLVKMPYSPNSLCHLRPKFLASCSEFDGACISKV